jgi:multiple sugar transport system substrate-binding protein
MLLINKRNGLLAAVFALSAVGMAGCGKDAAEGPAAQPASSEPVKLKVFFFQPGFVDQDFNTKFLPYLQKKFPNISYELVNPSKEMTINSMIAAGQVPDLIFSGEKEVPQLSVLGISEDLNALIKENKLDMGQFEAIADTTIKSYSDKGEMLALPYALQYYATFYNKDIFDKFGVPYPKDGMTWDDLIGIAKKLTRNEGGVQYYGLQAGNLTALAQKFGLELADPKTKKALIDTDGWRKNLTLGQQIYGIPGNLPPLAKFNGVSTIFTQDQNVAIAPYYGDTFINSLEKLRKEGKPMNWDMTSHPTLKELPGKSHELSFRSMVVSKSSKYKKQAFQVAQYIATSEDTQLQLSKDGFQAAMKDDKYKKAFGANIEVLKGKNISAIFKTTPLPIHNINDFDSPVKKALDQPFYDFLSGKFDANTALRTAQEAADKAIAGMK